jgi:hypothetical protein
MSPRLAISAAISILVMAGFALSSSAPAPEPFGADAAQSETHAATLAPADSGMAPPPRLFR